MTYTIEELRKKNLIIFEAITGSHAYGTSTPESDTDIRGVFVQPLEDVLKFGFIEQVSDEKNDVIFYELGRFINLLIDNNPNILELLSVPEDCVIYRDPEFQFLEGFKQKFLSKRVRWTFAGYAIDQIKKARGYNKKMNWEESQMVRKTVLDFCYVIWEGQTYPLEGWFKNAYFLKWTTYKMDMQKLFGLAKIDHAHDLYAMYDLEDYDIQKGIVSDILKANDVQLTSIPKDAKLVAHISFNKDGYSSHCRKYAEYQTWLKERNPNRVRMNKEHGKNYDSKNMMHTYRLLLMAHELAKGELRIRRTPKEIELLMRIRRGEYEYDSLLSEAEAMITTLDEAFERSTLPDKVDADFGYKLLGKLRDHYYFIIEKGNSHK